MAHPFAKASDSVPISESSPAQLARDDRPQMHQSAELKPIASGEPFSRLRGHRRFALFLAVAPAWVSHFSQLQMAGQTVVSMEEMTRAALASSDGLLAAFEQRESAESIGHQVSASQQQSQPPSQPHDPRQAQQSPGANGKGEEGTPHTNPKIIELQQRIIAQNNRLAELQAARDHYSDDNNQLRRQLQSQIEHKAAYARCTLAALQSLETLEQKVIPQRTHSAHFKADLAGILTHIRSFLPNE